MSQILSLPLEKILDISRHSPSSHNTQPWKVQIKNSEAYIGFDPSRQLLVGDPEKRELFISLGCFIESFVCSAAELGYRVRYQFLGYNPRAFVRLSLNKASPDSEAWSKLIKSRRSDRRFYQSKKLDPIVLNKLQSLSTNGVTLRLFTDISDINFLAKETFDATLEAMSNPAFRLELASWVRNNWTKQTDGMPAYTQGIPGPISLIAPLIIKKNKKISVNQAKKDSKRIAHSSAIGLICSDRQTPESLIKAGKLYQRASLVATKHNVKTAGISAAVVNPLTTKNIIRKFKLETTPVSLIRFGYTKNLPKKSPRLSIKQFTTVD
ncbi:MAG: hypothetical protein ACREF5_02620 [Candidatus Saccharimonadales bacterium]